MRQGTRFLTMVVVLAIAALASACSRDPASPATTSSPDAEAAALSYARCMRDHGVDMPDPQVDAQGRIKIPLGQVGSDVTGGAFQRAQKACRHLLPGSLQAPDPSRLAELQDQLVKFTTCMREHGVDMPDPDFSGGGGVLIGGPGSKIDPSDPAFQRAQRACNRLLPGGGGAGDVIGPGSDSGT